MAVMLKARLAAGELIVGTFVETPSPIVVELLGRAGLDCLCSTQRIRRSIAPRSTRARCRRAEPRATCWSACPPPRPSIC